MLFAVGAFMHTAGSHFGTSVLFLYYAEHSPVKTECYHYFNCILAHFYYWGFVQKIVYKDHSNLAKGDIAYMENKSKNCEIIDV